MANHLRYIILEYVVAFCIDPMLGKIQKDLLRLQRIVCIDGPILDLVLILAQKEK